MRTAPERLVRLYKMLGETTRQRILGILSSHSREPICVNDISRLLGISQSSASQHLRILKTMNCVREKKRGCHVFYALNVKKMHEYKELIDETFLYV